MTFVPSRLSRSRKTRCINVLSENTSTGARCWFSSYARWILRQRFINRWKSLVISSSVWLTAVVRIIQPTFSTFGSWLPSSRSRIRCTSDILRVTARTFELGLRTINRPGSDSSIERAEPFSPRASRNTWTRTFCPTCRSGCSISTGSSGDWARVSRDPRPPALLNASKPWRSSPISTNAPSRSVLTAVTTPM